VDEWKPLPVAQSLVAEQLSPAPLDVGSAAAAKMLFRSVHNINNAILTSIVMRQSQALPERRAVLTGMSVTIESKPLGNQRLEPREAPNFARLRPSSDQGPDSSTAGTAP
jgi:hypothetical protein